MKVSLAVCGFLVCLFSVAAIFPPNTVLASSSCSGRAKEAAESCSGRQPVRAAVQGTRNVLCKTKAVLKSVLVRNCNGS